jgi:hypothetical protein
LWPRGLGGITKSDVLVLGFFAALTLGSAPTGAPGDGEGIELQWSTPAGCPAAGEVQRLVGQLVPGTAARLRVIARIDAVAGGFQGTLQLETEASSTTRSLQADDCTVLARAMAVVVAVSLDPVAVAGAAEATAVADPDPVIPGPSVAEPLSSRSRPRVSEPPQAAEVGRGRASSPGRAEPPEAAESALELGARLGAGIGGLLLPAPGVGLSFAPFVGTARIHVRAVAEYWAPQRVTFDPRRDASGEVQLVTGGVRVCPQLAWPRVRLPLCAGVDAGGMLGRGTGRDLATSRSAGGPWVGAVLEPGVTLSVTSRVSLWLALEGVISLYRPLFAIGGAPGDWTAGAGAVRGLVGVQVHVRRGRERSP